jgi:hypothetical protein
MDGVAAEFNMDNNQDIIELLALLFKEKADRCKAYADFWADDPKKYGADKETIGEQRGRAAAWEHASELLMKRIKR